MSKSTRALSLFIRPILRARPLSRSQHSLLQNRGQVDIRPVRFQRAPFRYSGIIRFTAKVAFAGYITYLISEYLLEYDEEEGKPEPETTAPSIAVASKPIQQGIEGTKAPEVEAVEELLAQLPEKMPEDAIFIPLWWGTRRPPTYYKNTDPEWRGYVKFANDKKRIAATKEVLVSKIVELANHPNFTQTLGTPVRLHAAWLDFDYPLSPPPEYERPGIEIGDGYVALITRPQSQENYKRVSSALWPAVAAKSFYDSCRVFWSLKYMRFKGLLNVNTEAEKSKPPIASIPLDPRQMTKPPEKQVPQMGSKLEKLSDPKSTNTKSTNATAPEISGAKLPAPSKILSYLPSLLKQTNGDLRAVATTFHRSLLLNWRHPAVYDRGAICISGLVDVIGSKGRLCVDVRATFHPQTNQLKILQITLRRAGPNRLGPRG